MRDLPSKAKTQADSVPTVATKEEMQHAFIELVGERYGYWLGRRMKQQEMAEQTKAEATKARKLANKEREEIEELVKSPNQKTANAIQKTREDLKSARKTLKEARQPFMEKITPLAKAVRFFDNVVIPDSLKELGSPVAPRFSLSELAEKGIESKQKQ